MHASKLVYQVQHFHNLKWAVQILTDFQLALGVIIHVDVDLRDLFSALPFSHSFAHHFFSLFQALNWVNLNYPPLQSLSSSQLTQSTF